MDVEKFARAVRGHWSIENSLHWVLDVQCGEDRSRARCGNAAANLATLRRHSLNLLNYENKPKNAASKENNSTPLGIITTSCVFSPFNAFALLKRLNLFPIRLTPG